MANNISCGAAAIAGASFTGRTTVVIADQISRRAAAVGGADLLSRTAALEATDFGGGATVITAARLGATQVLFRIATLQPGRATELAVDIARVPPRWAARIRWTGSC